MPAGGPCGSTRPVALLSGAAAPHAYVPAFAACAEARIFFFPAITTIFRLNKTFSQYILPSKNEICSSPIAKYNDFLLSRSHAVAEKTIFTPEDVLIFSIW